MNLLALILNAAMLGFTCMVLVTDGLPKDPDYIFFAVLLFFVPVLNLIMIVKGAGEANWLNFKVKDRMQSLKKADLTKPSKKAMIRPMAVFCNVLIIVLTVWALFDQAPHPRENGVIIYTVLLLLAPGVSLWAILTNNAYIAP